MTRLAIVLSVLGISLCTASTAAAARSEFFGIVQGQLEDQDLQGMAAAGVRTARFELGWKSLEPSRDSYRWARSDTFIGRLASRGIRPLPFVWMTPPWVATTPARPPLDQPQDIQAWREFLRAAVARYGPGGSYWTTGYRQRYGANATPLPIQSWQIWNEPNLKKFFDPDGSDQASAWKYARLLRISHDAIKNTNPNARIVLAGNPGYPPSGGLRAWDFLDTLYDVPGIKSEFDVAALHPYSSSVDGLRQQLQLFRAVMRKHGDGGTPLWITELGWGSAPPDRFGINQGLMGQAAAALRRLQDDPEPPRRLERAAIVLVFVARSPPGVNVRAPVQLLRQCGACEVRRHREARLHPVQGLREREDPAPGEHHRGAAPGRLHQQLHP